MKRKCKFLIPENTYGSHQLLFDACRYWVDGEENVGGHEDTAKHLRQGGYVFSENLEGGFARTFEGRGIFAEYSNQIIPYITKHPFDYIEELNRLHPDTVIYASDKSYCDFIETYCKRKAEFLPMPGLKSREMHRWEDREDIVFFPGTYLSPKAMEEYIEKWTPQALQPLMWQVIEKKENKPELTTEYALRAVLTEQNLVNSAEVIADFLKQFGSYIEEYISRKQRVAVLRTLLKNKIPVIVCGLNWDVFSNEITQKEKVYLKLFENNLSMQLVADYMGKVKVVLNIAANQKNGIHERVASALASRACCFTESNPYVKELMQTHENLRTYDYENLPQLVRDIKKVLKQRESMETANAEALTVRGFSEKLRTIIGVEWNKGEYDKLLLKERLAYSREFDSYLLTGLSNWAEIDAAVGGCQPRHIYVMTEDRKKFDDIFKIPKEGKYVAKNVTLFETEEELKRFFRENKREYLPRVVISPQKSYYEKIIRQLHKERLASGKRKRNVYLSVCIPTYNRGNEALRAVKRLMESTYDEEIEIVVSDNTSVKTQEIYKQIEELNDSRICYQRLEKNLSYIGNVANVLSMAHGRYMVIQSDEDLLRVGNIHSLLNELINNEDVSMGICPGEGTNFNPYFYNGVQRDFIQNLDRALSQNYITGMLYSKEGVSKALERLDSFRENDYAVYYTHSYFLANCAELGNALVSRKILFDEGDVSKTSSHSKEFMYEFTKPEMREKIFEAMMACVMEMYSLRDEDLSYILERRVSHVFHMLGTAWHYYGGMYRQNGITFAVLCLQIYDWGMKLAETYREYMQEEVYQNLCNQITMNYEFETAMEDSIESIED